MSCSRLSLKIRRMQVLCTHPKERRNWRVGDWRRKVGFKSGGLVLSDLETELILILVYLV
jgi:hypothetical protein